MAIPGMPGFSLPKAEDDTQRRLRDIERRATEQAAVSSPVVPKSGATFASNFAVTSEASILTSSLTGNRNGWKVLRFPNV